MATESMCAIVQARGTVLLEEFALAGSSFTIWKLAQCSRLVVTS